MNKDTKFYLIAVIIVLAIIAGIYYYRNINSNPDIIDKKTAECIASKSALYVQTGCPHCKIQEDMFGEYLDSLNIIDCLNSPDKCTEAGVEQIPTWIIAGQKHIGIRTIKELKELTGC